MIRPAIRFTAGDVIMNSILGICWRMKPDRLTLSVGSPEAGTSGRGPVPNPAARGGA